MVVGAPDVDEVVEPSAELLDDVADVGPEICVVAVRLADHPVLVVAVVRRAEPEGAVLVVETTARAQALDRTIHPPVAIERALGLPDIESNAQPGERRFDPGADLLGCPLAEDPGRLAVAVPGGLRHLVRHSRREVADVGAVVAVLGQRRAVEDRRDRRAEIAHLGAEVVEVVLARHGVAGRFKHAAEQVADEGAPRVADVEGPCRVGADELHVHVARGGRRHAAPGGGRGEDAADEVLEGGIGEAQVEESRGGHGRGRDDGGRAGRDAGVELRGQGLGDPQGRHPVRPRELHREIGRQVAMLGVGRSLDIDRRAIAHSEGRQRSGCFGTRPGGCDVGAGTRAKRGQRRGRGRRLEWLGHGNLRVPAATRGGRAPWYRAQGIPAAAFRRAVIGRRSATFVTVAFAPAT